MIYYTNGLRNNQLTPIPPGDRSDFKRLADRLKGDEKEKTPPLSLDIGRDRDIYKQNNAMYIIAGELTKLIRKNVNMANRSLLVLDLDDIKADEQSFTEAISPHFIDFKYLAYPTISHNVKGTRYRLIFDISRPITSAEEYSKLIDVMTGLVYDDILKQSDYKADTSNKTFSQLQGWYVKTEQNKDSPILIHTEGKPLPVDELLAIPQKPAQNDFKGNCAPTHYGTPREWTKVVRTLIDGEIHEGERHQFYLMAFRAILFGCGDDDESLGYYIDLIEKFNASRCFPPYTPDELKKEYSEANKFVRRKRGANTWEN